MTKEQIMAMSLSDAKYMDKMPRIRSHVPLPGMVSLKKLTMLHDQACQG